MLHVFKQKIRSQDLTPKCQILLITSIKIPMFMGKAASGNMAQPIALAALATSMAAVQSTATRSTHTASLPTARTLGLTNSFKFS